MRPKPLTLSLVLALATGNAASSPADFARGRLIDVDPVADVHRVRIPRDVYEWVTRDDLGDLRVFNGHGDEVAYLVRRPGVTEETTKWNALPVFAWPAGGGPDADAAAVNIELADGGTVVAVRGATVETDGPATYLIDASRYAQPIDELKLGWIEDADDFVASVSIEGSDDLGNWRLLTAGATVAALSADGERIKLDTLEISGARTKYLRLRQTDNGSPLSLAQVSARSKRAHAPERAWKVLDGLPTDDGFEFEAGGRFPIDRVSLEYAAPTYLVEVRLFSRAEPKARWRDRGKRTFYRAAVDGRVAAAEPVKYATTYDRYWRAEIPGDEPPGGPPTLTIGWAPDEVVFLRQGPPPFTLAFGRAGTLRRDWPMGNLLKSLDEGQELADLPFSPLGQGEALGGPDKLQAEPEPVNWRSIVLWSVLVIGVVIIGGLALRLARD